LCSGNDGLHRRVILRPGDQQAGAFKQTSCATSAGEVFLISNCSFQKSRAWRRAPALALSLACVGTLLACASNAPPPSAPLVPQASAATLPELLQRADVSAKEGRRELSRLQYREAARAHPTAAAPWSKLAEDYFESGDHGNAILAAQEVVQREPQNVVAHSVLTLSGLRVSNTALVALREQQSGVPGITREQALTLSRSLREALGETVLAPRIVEGGATAPMASRNKPPAASGSAAQAPAAAASGAAKAKAKSEPEPKPKPKP
jgi:tetratricopeptide (TPR) repeat protein